jgi:hypothetical protein
MVHQRDKEYQRGEFEDIRKPAARRARELLPHVGMTGVSGITCEKDVRRMSAECWKSFPFAPGNNA